MSLYYAGVEPKFNIAENLCFSLIHGNRGQKTVDLMASTQDQRDLWVKGLKYTLSTYQDISKHREYDL